MKEYALIRFNTNTGNVAEIVTAKIASMLKINALNKATSHTSSVIVDMDNGFVIYAVMGRSKVRDGFMGTIDNLGIPFEQLKKTLAD